MLHTNLAGRPIMQYVRELEGRVLQLRGVQSRFKLLSFACGVVAGVALSLAWYFLAKR